MLFRRKGDFMSLPSTLASDVGKLSACFLARDYFLVPVKTGVDEGCENLQEKVDTLRKKMDVPIPIKVVKHSAFPWHAHGALIYGSGGITVPRLFFFQASEDAQIAILAHEIAHIKHNDGPMLLVTLIIIEVVFNIFLWSVLPAVLLPYLGLIMYIPFFTGIFLRSVYQERLADLEACKYTTNTQKRAMIEVFENLRQKNLEWRNDPAITGIWKSLRRLRVDEKGDSLFARITHPPLTERICYITEQIKPEPISYISKIKNYMRSFIPSKAISA
jgi:Zn-dependent protease with chaperone function